MKSSTLVKIILSLLFCSGILILGIYILMIGASEQQLIPEFFFWLGALLFSSSLVLLSSNVKNTYYRILLIVVSAFFIYSLGFLRSPFYGTDIVGEYSVATTTLSMHRWPVELVSAVSYNQYFSCLSVTILPAMMSEVTGLSMMMVFKILVPLLATFVALGVFLVIRTIFDERIAFLSTIVFILSGNTALLKEMVRQSVALFLLLLAIYLIFSRYGSNRIKVILLSLIFLIVIPTAHYSMVYFALLFLLIIFIVEKMHRHLSNILSRLRIKSNNSLSTFSDSRNTFLTLGVLLVAALAGFLWLLTVSYPTFSFNTQVGASSIPALLGFGRAVYSYQVGNALVSSLGAYHTIINWVVRGLTIVGFLVALKLHGNVRSLAFSLCGGIMFLVLLINLVLPNINLLLALDRTYLVGMIAFSSFIALVLIEIPKKLIHMSVRFWSVPVSVVIVVAIFLTSFVPMTYLPENAATQQYTLSKVPALYSSSDLAFAQWLQTSTNSKTIFSGDEKGYAISVGFASRQCFVLSPENSTDTVSQVQISIRLGRPVILSRIVDWAMWFGSSSGISSNIFVQSSDLNEMLQSVHSDVVFSNGRSFLLMPSNT